MAKNYYADIQSAPQAPSDIMMSDFLKYGPKYHHFSLEKPVDLVSKIKGFLSKGDV